jgi:hypothetical protein
MQNQLLLDEFVNTYQKLDKNNLELLTQIYSHDVCFIDPMHQVNGIQDLTHYFANLYSNVKFCNFEITDSFVSGDNAFIYWNMQYAHPKLASGNTITVQGHSKLQFSGNKVSNHRDYFNVADMLYKHIPLLGSAIKFIDKRAG